MGMILLLSENDLSKNTPMNGNIDVDRWVPCVKDAQKTELEPILGNILYKKICNDYYNDQLTGDYLELYEDYIKDYLMHESASLYLSIGAYLVTNAGITKQNPEGTIAVSKEEVDYLVVEQRRLANNYRRKLLQYLKKNKDNFIEYVNDSCYCNDGDLSTIGVYFRRKRIYRNY